MAVPGRPAAPLPVPVPQRLRFAVPDPRLHRGSRGRGVADRQRGRVPPRTGQSDRDERQPAAPGPGRTRRPHRGLHEGAARQPRAAQRRPRRALPRWRRLPDGRPGDDRADHAVPRRAGARRGSHDTARLPRAAGDRRDAPRDPHPVTRADRGDGHGRRRQRRGSRGPGCGEAGHHGRVRGAAGFDVGGPDHGDPCPRRHRGLGVLQHHRRRASHAHPRDRVRGREPRRPHRDPRRGAAGSRRISPTATSPCPSLGRPGSRTR